MKTLRWLLMLVAVPALAWDPVGGAPKNDTNEQLALLFGKNTAFSATAVMSAKNARGKEKAGAELEYMFLDGKMRAEVDITKTKAGGGNSETMAMLQSIGLDKVVTIVRPDKKMTYVVYPGANGYCEFPQTIAAGATNQPPKIEKVELGKETVENHPCVKYKMTVTATDGKKYESTVWQATDLNDFPVKSEMQSEGDTVTTVFKNVKLTAPPKGMFEILTGWKKYDSLNQLMMGGMQDMLKSLGGK